MIWTEPYKKMMEHGHILQMMLLITKDKINRKFNNLINILGGDHTGYVKRITAAVSALSTKKFY